MQLCAGIRGIFGFVDEALNPPLVPWSGYNIITKLGFFYLYY